MRECNGKMQFYCHLLVGKLFLNPVLSTNFHTQTLFIVRSSSSIRLKLKVGDIKIQIYEKRDFVLYIVLMLWKWKFKNVILRSNEPLFLLIYYNCKYMNTNRSEFERIKKTCLTIEYNHIDRDYAMSRFCMFTQWRHKLH